MKLAIAALALQTPLLAWLLHARLREHRRRRCKAESAVKRAAIYAWDVLHTINVPLVLLDRHLVVQLHNAAFAKLHDVLHAGIDGQPLSKLGGSAWQDPVLQQRLVDTLHQGCELWDVPYMHRTMDGQVRHLLLSVRRMPIPSDAAVLMLMTISDVTLIRAESHRVEVINQRLEAEVTRLNEVNAMLENFSSSVSHDLRAPLRHLRGFAARLQRHLGADLDAPARRDLDVIVEAAARMDRQIDGLLFYSCLGRAGLQRCAVDMQLLVEEVRRLLEASLGCDDQDMHDRPRRELRWMIGPLPVVCADQGMMRQLWLNLLDNAMKYTRDRAQGWITVTHAWQVDGSHLFTVRDNGAGFDMDRADRLFTVFQRLHAEDDYPGTGIGLASVRRVLEWHAGRIWAEAVPGQGACFKFTLPPMQAHCP